MTRMLDARGDLYGYINSKLGVTSFSYLPPPYFILANIWHAIIVLLFLIFKNRQIPVCSLCNECKQIEIFLNVTDKKKIKKTYACHSVFEISGCRGVQTPQKVSDLWLSVDNHVFMFFIKPSIGRHLRKMTDNLKLLHGCTLDTVLIFLISNTDVTSKM